MARKKKLPDYRDFQPVSEKAKAEADTSNKHEGYWWTAPRAAAHEPVFAAVDALEQQQSERRNSLDVYVRLYGDKDLVTRSARERAVSRMPSRESTRVTYNVVSSAVDTLRAKISKAKPKATFATDGGSWSQQRRAKRLDRYVQGVYHQEGVYAKARDVFRDGCVSDIGVLKWWLERDAQGKPTAIRCARVQPHRIIVDEVDAQDGSPRSLYEMAPVPREVLRAAFPKHAAAIDDADEPSALCQAQVLTGSLADYVEVREAWHLPSGPGAKDGRHVISISTATLYEEECEAFPFSFFRFDTRTSGFYGRCVAEQLVTRQRALNAKLKTLNEALHFFRPQYWVQDTGKEGGKLPLSHITNEVGTIVRSARPPQVLNSGSVFPQQLFEAVQMDITHALESVGVSRMDAAATKPAGLDSAPSLREYSDIASERFVLVGQAWEEFHLENARHIIRLSRQAKAEGRPLKATVERRRGIEVLDWDAVALDEASYVLKAFPTSSLPTTASARKQYVRELFQDGLIDGLTYQRLLDMPDLDTHHSAEFSAQEDIEELLERYLDEGEEDETPEYEPPEPFQDLVYGLKRFQSAYLRAKHQGCPEGRLELLRDWMLDAQKLLASQSGPPAAGAPGLPAGVSAAPVPAGALLPGGAPSPAAPAVPPPAGALLPSA